MAPQKYPQNLHTSKIFFSEPSPPQKKLKFKILNPKNDSSLSMHENIRVPYTPPPPPPVLKSIFWNFHLAEIIISNIYQFLENLSLLKIVDVGWLYLPQRLFMVCNANSSYIFAQRLLIVCRWQQRFRFANTTFQSKSRSWSRSKYAHT